MITETVPPRLFSSICLVWLVSVALSPSHWFFLLYYLIVFNHIWIVFISEIAFFILNLHSVLYTYRTFMMFMFFFKSLNVLAIFIITFNVLYQFCHLCYFHVCFYWMIFFLVIGHIFLLLCMFNNSWLDGEYCEWCRYEHFWVCGFYLLKSFGLILFC